MTAMRATEHGTRRATVVARIGLAAIAIALCVSRCTGAAGRATSSAAAPGCIGSGNRDAINKALVGQGAQAVLYPGAVFDLTDPVMLSAPGQKLYTQGRPTDGSRALLRIVNDNESTARCGSTPSAPAGFQVQADTNATM